VDEVLVLSVLVLAVSVPLLGRSADVFVTAVSRVATLYRLAPVLVGALIIGFGTSLPEALVSVLAALGGSRDVGVGNIVGSNVANLTLVLGPAALLCVTAFSVEVLRREMVLMLASAVLFAGLLFDGQLSRSDGALLLLGLVATVVALTRPPKGASTAPTEGASEEDASDVPTAGLWFRVALGLVGTVVGAYLLVWSAVTIAEHFGLTGGLVGVSLVAIGTSLPEMVTSYHAARRHEGELIVGNLLGSNMFNVLFVAGAAGLVGPGAVDAQLAGVATWTMVLVSLLVALLALVFRRVPRFSVPFLLAGYVLVLVAVA
jgi:cation:H+ antiporter